MSNSINRSIYALSSQGSVRHVAGPVATSAHPSITTFLGDALDCHALNLTSGLKLMSSHAAAWSGTVADGPFEPNFRTWSAPVRAQLHETLDRLMLSIPPDATVTLRPHARHVLADHHLASRFITSRWSRGEHRIRLLMDPASLFTRQMFTLAEDHCTRIIDQSAELVRFAVEQLTPPAGSSPLAGVLLAQLEDPSPSQQPIDPMDIDDGPALRSVPIHRAGGLLPMDVLLAAIARVLPSEVPIYLLDEQTDQQLAMLAARW
jgi:hypothetical protein